MFTQSCFIRKNTPEIKEKLEKLGYTNHGPENNYKNLTSLYCNAGHYYECINKPARYESIIDCQTNEDLFFALAALRNDSDINQWFIIPNIKFIRLSGYFPQMVGMDGHERIIDGYKWHLSDEDGISEKIRSHIEDGEDKKFLPHKATVKEIIEHFKNS